MRSSTGFSLARLALGALVLVSPSAFAAKGSSSFASSDSGCGLGSMVIQENTKVMQVLAATTNGIGGQTFAISTGTSNCKAQNLVMTEKAVQYFVEVNRDDLSREMAKGEGEKLQTLASLYGCETDASRAQFSKAAQAAFSRILPTATTAVDEMVQNLNHETSVVGVCGTI
jgi:hypothetical protein